MPVHATGSGHCQGSAVGGASGTARCLLSQAPAPAPAPREHTPAEQAQVFQLMCDVLIRQAEAKGPFAGAMFWNAALGALVLAGRAAGLSVRGGGWHRLGHKHTAQGTRNTTGTTQATTPTMMDTTSTLMCPLRPRRCPPRCGHRA